MQCANFKRLERILAPTTMLLGERSTSWQWCLEAQVHGVCYRDKPLSKNFVPRRMMQSAKLARVPPLSVPTDPEAVVL